MMSVEPPREQEPAVSYYGQPVLKRPRWGWNVVTYLFLGGIMGGSSLIAALADAGASQSQRRLVRNANRTSLALSIICPLVLISHLGRPERFLHMLRILKLKSPMSLGVWSLVAFSTIATASVAGLSPPGIVFVQAVIGSFIAGYTGVLISATAIPIWAKGKRHIPAVSVCSGIASAAALQSLLLVREGDDAREKLERLELAASAAELLILLDFRRYAGDYGAPMYTGPRGERFRALTLMAGLTVPLILNSSRAVLKVRGTLGRVLTVLSAAMTLLGGYVLRETLIEAGKTSADDPRAAFAQPE